MCIIAAKAAGVDWPGKKAMQNCYENNPQGAGLAWADEGGLQVSKGYFNWGRLWKDMRELRDCPVLLHCRLATHGSIGAENCHPFLLENGVAMAHNGVIDIEPLEKDMTDSESFGIRHVEPWSLDELRSERVLSLLELAVGGRNKLVMLDASGQFLFVNGELGELHKDVWFSNDGYRESWRDAYRAKTCWMPSESELTSHALKMEMKSLEESFPPSQDEWTDSDWDRYWRALDELDEIYGYDAVMSVL
jgi:glutamine amidotransferase